MNKISLIESRLVSKEYLPVVFNKSKNKGGFNSITVSFSNPASILALMEYDDAIDIDLFFSDGFFYTSLYNLFNNKKIIRASFDFSSIADDVFLHASESKLKVCLIGATDSEINKSYNNIKSRYPNLEITSYRSGYFADGELSNYLNKIDVDLFIIGMGAPLQEHVCKVIKSIFPKNKLVFTCGAFLSQTAISSDYYPSFIKKTGLRWLYRCIKENHVLKRLIVKYPKFLFVYLKYQYGEH